MSEVFFALLCILLILWISWRWKHTSYFSNLDIPGPKPNLIFGNILELYIKGPIQCHKEWTEKYGKIVGFFYGMKPMLLVADPQLLKNIFIKDFSSFTDRTPFSPIVSTDPKDESLQSVITLKGQKWKEVRSVLTPSFTTSKMKQMAVTINSSISTMIDVMSKKAANGEIFDIHDSFQRLTMDVITRTAFGFRVDVQTNVKSSILKATKMVFRTSYYDIVILIGLSFPWLSYIAIHTQLFLLTLLNRGISPINMLRQNLTEVLEHRKKNPEARKPDLLQLMIDTKITVDATDVDEKALEAGGEEHEAEPENKQENTSKITRNMRDKEIVASSFTVFLAGYETTSTALAFTSYLLAKHPDIQEKAFKEVKELFQKEGKLEYDTVNQLPYLDKVLSESMRVYPPVFLFTNRYAVQDVQYDSLKIPKGMLIQAPVYLLHHDPDYWPDPEAFDPERFNTKTNTNGITYMPFGAGPRNCMGLRFAQMEAKLALAHTLHKFRLVLPDGSKGELPISQKTRTLSPTHGVKVKLYARSHETDL